MPTDICGYRNILFVILGIVAAMINEKHIVFSSSVFALLPINSLAHVATTIKQKKYSPSLISAVLLFIPIGVVGYTGLLSNNSMTILELMISMLFGVLWMSAPFIYQVVRVASEKRA